MSDHEESELLLKTHCPCGQSSDAFAIYDDGHGFCFSGTCNRRFGAKELREQGYDGVIDEEMAEADTAPAARPKKGPNGFPLHGATEALAKRGINEKTAQKWGYRRVDFAGKRNLHCADYRDASGKVVAQKIRFPDKSFTWIGDKKAVDCLYGQWLWKSGGRMVVITEGELDALSVSQLQDNKWPVVSLVDGAGSAVRGIKKSLQWLSSFDQVILMFDNDEAGQEAVEEAVALFPPGKVRVASLPLKDPNEMLLARRGKEVVEAMWNAREWRPDGIVNAAECWEDFVKVRETSGTPYPWEGLTYWSGGGIRPGELVTVTAGSGIGKSSMCREIAHFLLKGGHKVGYVALEENNGRTLQEMVSLELNRRLVRSQVDEEDPPTEEELRAAFDRVTGDGNLYLYDHFGSLNSDTLLGHIRYMHVALGVSVVFLDHLSIVVSGDDTMDDERRGIDLAMTKLRSLVEETGLALILVSHLKRPEGRGHEDGAQTSLAQLRGSAAIAQLSDFVLGLERDQQAPKGSNRVTVRMLKNRYMGDLGIATKLRYDPQTGRLIEDLEPDIDPEDTDDPDGDY